MFRVGRAIRQGLSRRQASLLLACLNTHSSERRLRYSDQPAYAHLNLLINHYKEDAKPEMLICPIDESVEQAEENEDGTYTLDEETNSYAYAKKRMKAGSRGASKRFLAADDYSNREDYARHSNGSAMAVFADGSVTTVLEADIPEEGVLEGLVSDQE